MGAVLNEVEKRRPDFREGAPVVMLDGQSWHLPKPLLRWGLGPGPRGRVRHVVSPVPDFKALTDHMEKCLEFELGLDSGDPEETEKAWREHPELDLLSAQLAVGRALLLANYDLTGDELDSLMLFATDPDSDPEAYRLKLDVMEVARGVAPKPRAAGSESP